MQLVKAAILSLAIWTPALASSVTDKNLEICRAKLKAAHKLDLLYDLQVKGAQAIVVVGPTYDTLPFDAREGFAETVNCFLMAGDTSKFVSFDLLDYQTHKVVATWSWGHLTSQ